MLIRFIGTTTLEPQFTLKTYDTSSFYSDEKVTTFLMILFYWPDGWDIGFSGYYEYGRYVCMYFEHSSGYVEYLDHVEPGEIPPYDERHPK